MIHAHHILKPNDNKIHRQKHSALYFALGAYLIYLFLKFIFQLEFTFNIILYQLHLSWCIYYKPTINLERNNWCSGETWALVETS